MNSWNSWQNREVSDYYGTTFKLTSDRLSKSGGKIGNRERSESHNLHTWAWLRGDSRGPSDWHCAIVELWRGGYFHNSRVFQLMERCEVQAQPPPPPTTHHSVVEEPRVYCIVLFAVNKTKLRLQIMLSTPCCVGKSGKRSRFQWLRNKRLYW